MRAKRAKQYRKLMQKYELHFGFRAPYQVLLDADIIRAASRFKMRLGGMLGSTLSASDTKPMITQCCIRHLYDAPAATETERREKEGWIEVAKQAERRRCGHHELETPLSTIECLSSVVDGKGNSTNKHRYVVASQDPEVRAKMRLIAGVPLVYINRSVMILEPMAARSDELRVAEEKGKLRAGLRRSGGALAGTKRTREDRDDGEVDAVPQPLPQKKRSKGPKGPNPLSVKKSKKDGQGLAPSRREGDGDATMVHVASKNDVETAGSVEDKSAAVEREGENQPIGGPEKRKRKRKPRSGTENADIGGGDGR